MTEPTNQDLASKALKVSHRDQNHHEELLNKLQEIEKRFDTIEDKLNPMYELFANVRGFNGVAVWIIKGLILLGAGIGVLYGLVKWFKN